MADLFSSHSADGFTSVESIDKLYNERPEITTATTATTISTTISTTPLSHYKTLRRKFYHLTTSLIASENAIMARVIENRTP